MTLDFISHRQLFVVLGLCLPLTALWGYALVDSLRSWAQRARRDLPVDPSAPPLILDEGTWALLILLSGWFGALAYLLVMVPPRLVASHRRRLSLSV